MIDDSTLEKIDELCKIYKNTYNKEVDFTLLKALLDKKLTQEKLAKCIELMISDNLSLICAYDKLYLKQ